MTTEQLQQMLTEALQKRNRAYEEYQQYHGAAQILTHLLAVLKQETTGVTPEKEGETNEPT